MRNALANVRRYARMTADAQSATQRRFSLTRGASAAAELDELADQWVRLHRLLDPRTAVLVARAIRSQFPDPEQREKYMR
jgi:hypothetical protein